MSSEGYQKPNSKPILLICNYKLYHEAMYSFFQQYDAFLYFQSLANLNNFPNNHALCQKQLKLHNIYRREFRKDSGGKTT